VLDWQYWDDHRWGDHHFHADRFPDPDGMIKELHDELNTRIMISIWPKYNVMSDNYKVMEQKGFLYTRNVEVGNLDWVGPGYLSTFYDAFNEGARKLNSGVSFMIVFMYGVLTPGGLMPLSRIFIQMCHGKRKSC
jgi:alpha-D-xyloside xylohydrolase